MPSVFDYLPWPPIRPTRSVVRRWRLLDLAQARWRAWPQPSWRAVFVRAQALVAVRHPALRTTSCRLIRAHTLALVAVEQNPSRLVPIPRPEQLDLWTIDEMLNSPPPPHRWQPKALWRQMMRWLEQQRAHVLSTVRMQTEGTHPGLPTWRWSSVDECGQVEVTLTYNPRQLTDEQAESALDDLERVLRQEIMIELRYAEGLEAA